MVLSSPVLLPLLDNRGGGGGVLYRYRYTLKENYTIFWDFQVHFMFVFNERILKYLDFLFDLRNVLWWTQNFFPHKHHPYLL